MEDDKKKKRNKKKKQQQQNKQVKAADDTTSSNAGETSSVSADQDDVSNTSSSMDHNHHHPHPPPDNNGTVLVDNGKQHWLQEEAKLKDMLKQLLYEKNSHLQTQADLEMRIEQLQSENESLHHKEVSLEQKISQLLQEKAASSSEERNLLEKFQHVEKEKHALVEKENKSKDMIETLSTENARLKMQVLELEGARDSVSQENKMLLNNVSILQSRVQDLEMNMPVEGSAVDAQKDVSEKDNLNAQMEEAYALVGKLITENAELVEKINELYVELGQRDLVSDHTSTDIPGDSISNPVNRPAQHIQEDISLSTNSAKAFETASIGDEQMLNGEMNSGYDNAFQQSSEATVSGEIVQIPLEENESQDLEAQASVDAGDDSVPLADAPLIGAPFRLISFFAKYVSGADLVNEGSSNSLE